MHPYRLVRRFRSVSEERPGPAFEGIVERGWSGWRAWFSARGGTQATSPDEARRELRRYMPELERLLERLKSFRRDDPLFPDFLGFWCPPRYLVSCSQAVAVDQDGPFLIRNYDLDPSLSEATLLLSTWRGKPVAGMVEGLAGLSDGMNGNGLAVSLTFGGRAVVGRGFGIPLIVRYVLETCTDTKDALEALRLVPCHMSYNVTVIDREGRFATAFLSPDRPPIITRTPWATNHQLGVEWPRHGRISATKERAQVLARLFDEGQSSEPDLAASFAAGPMFLRNYRGGFGTVFSAVYRPVQQTVSLAFGKDRAPEWDLSAFQTANFDVEYSESGSRILRFRKAVDAER